MNEASVQKFVLDILRVAGANLEEVANHAYRTQVPPELARFFPGKRSLHFTFDEEYFDLHLESGVDTFPLAILYSIVSLRTRVRGFLFRKAF
jgi:hypothetical protein